MLPIGKSYIFEIKTLDDSVQLKCPVTIVGRHHCPRTLVKVVVLKKARDSWVGLSFALAIVVHGGRHGNGLDPKSSNHLWVSSLLASVAFLLVALPPRP
jgi:hypothetical protein